MMVYRVSADNPDEEALKAAVLALQEGGLVIFPTETVYGLAADAFNPDAVRKVFDAKQRPMSEALPVQVGSVEDIRRVVRNLSNIAERLIDRFFPGPLTLVVEKNPDLPDVVTGGSGTVGVRMPDHPVALAMIKKFGSAIVATSANISGRSDPLTADDAIAQLGESVDVVLDAGAARIGSASTVVDVTCQPMRILRVGPITAEEIASAIGEGE